MLWDWTNEGAGGCMLLERDRREWRLREVFRNGIAAERQGGLVLLASIEGACFIRRDGPGYQLMCTGIQRYASLILTNVQLIESVTVEQEPMCPCCVQSMLKTNLRGTIHLHVLVDADGLRVLTP